MTAPVFSPGINILPNPPGEPAGTTYGPDNFYWPDNVGPDPATQPNEPLPRSWSQGGLIESVKRAVITGLRESFSKISMLTDPKDEEFYIDIEYPTDITNYPAIWVQFGIEKLNRAGLGMETWVRDPNKTGNWIDIQEWMFDGRVSLSIAALSSKDRDRLADSVVAHLAFSRPPDLVIRDPRRDTQQFRGLITTLENNPYVRMTLNLDTINPGGATVTNGVPWAPNVLLYEDNYSISCQGQFNMQFSHDGVYSLASINLVSNLMASTARYNPAQWLGVNAASPESTSAPELTPTPPGLSMLQSGLDIDSPVDGFATGLEVLGTEAPLTADLALFSLTQSEPEQAVDPDDAYVPVIVTTDTAVAGDADSLILEPVLGEQPLTVDATGAALAGEWDESAGAPTDASIPDVVAADEASTPADLVSFVIDAATGEESQTGDAVAPVVLAVDETTPDTVDSPTPTALNIGVDEPADAPSTLDIPSGVDDFAIRLETDLTVQAEDSSTGFSSPNLIETSSADQTSVGDASGLTLVFPTEAPEGVFDTSLSPVVLLRVTDTTATLTETTSIGFTATEAATVPTDSANLALQMSAAESSTTQDGYGVGVVLTASEMRV